jgi:hypothetical protein
MQPRGYCKQFTYNVSASDRSLGIVGYSRDIEVCPITGKFTNFLFLSTIGRIVSAYSQEAANTIDSEKETS